MSEDQVVFVQNAGYFLVTAVNPSSTNFFGAEYMDINANVNTGSGVIAGWTVGPAGPPIVLTPPTNLTDNTGGTATDTLAVGAGITTLAFFISAVAIANGDLLTEYVPGYKFAIVKFDARCAAAVTTGSKASTLNLEIGTTNVTGGVISLAGTYAIGAGQAGTAITAANTGSATDSFSIEASATTAFVEGAFWLSVSIKNMDTADALASLASKTNEVITAIS